METVNLYVVNIELGIKHKQFLLESVNEEQKEKALSFAYEIDQVRSLLSSYLKNQLSKDKLLKKKMGKPYFDHGPFFNISHSGELVALAICEDSNVGIDIEKVDEKKINGIKSILCENEKNTKNPGDLFKIWSNKESILKCRLEPLIDVRKVSGLPFDGVRELDNRLYYTKSMIYEGYSLSATVEGDKPFKLNIKNVTVSELEK